MIVVRAAGVLWRVTADRVLVRRVAPSGQSEASDLVGAAALVWVAADRASTVDEVAAETGLDADVVRSAAGELVAAGWIVTPTYRALDYVFRVDADPPLGDVVAAALAGLVTESTDSPVATARARRGGDGSWELSDEASPLPYSVLGGGLDLGAALARLLEHVNQRAAASVSAGVALHAATVTTGRVGLALTGRSGSGKSTLGLAAALGGWRIVAEELSVVDASTLEVRPYPRPVGVRRGGAAALGLDYPTDPVGMYAQVWPRPIDSDMLAAEASLSAIVLVSRQAGCVPCVEAIRPARALAELAEHCVVPEDHRLVAQFRDLERLVRAVPVRRITYDDVADGVVLLDQVAGEVGT